MRIDHVTKTHRIGGRMVLVKRHSAKRGVEGYTVKLEGGVTRFYAKGEDVEVTTVR